MFSAHVYIDHIISGTECGDIFQIFAVVYHRFADFYSICEDNIGISDRFRSFFIGNLIVNFIFTEFAEIIPGQISRIDRETVCNNNFHFCSSNHFI